MPAEYEIALTFIVYLLFFGWIGYRRGFRAELTVFLVALLGWIGLTIFGDIVVQVANLGGKFVSFALSGGLGASEAEALALLQQAPDFITTANRDSFLFVIWVILVVLAYIFSSPRRGPARGGGAIPLTPGILVDTIGGILSGQGPTARAPADSRLRGWAVIFGMANGLLFSSIFLPRLLALLVPGGWACCPIPDGAGPLSILVSGLAVVFDSIQQLWRLVGPYGPWIALILVTLFLLVAAGSLRGGSNSGSGSANAKT